VKPGLSRRFLLVLPLTALGGTAVRAQDAPAPRAAGIPFRQDPPSALESPRGWLGILAVLLALGGGVWWLRRRLPGPTSAGTRVRRMKLQETLRLSPRSTLHLVEVDGRTVLLAEHAQGLTALPADPAYPTVAKNDD
jgi:flagellar biogenesis protein FliO